jgi:hypothetical protein
LNETVTRCLGLVTQYNPLTTAPGALIKADNCVIRRENIVEDRRGYASYASLSSAINQLMVYSSRVLSHAGSQVLYDNGSGTFAAYSGSLSAPSGQKMRFVEAFSNLYVTTDAGVKVITDLAGTAGRSAGAPRSLNATLTLNAGGTAVMANNQQTAYRFVIQRTDANSNPLNSYPSTRCWISNTAGAGRNVDVKLYLPAEATTSDVIQVYRTAAAAYVSSDSAGDEMALVYQASPAAADITAGFISFTDSITDALRGAALYTSPSQEGISQANDRPPLCKDMALYRSLYMMYANTSTKQRLFVTLVGTSGLNTRTLTIAGTTYTFTTGAENAATGTVAISGTGTAAVDIDLTARSLERVINSYASNTSVYAYYLSGPSDLPGQLMIEERGIGAAAFTVLAGDTTVSANFFPPPPVGTPNTKSTSSNSVQKNAVFFSKSQQPEAVPSLNYVLVGPANKNILRIVALRDSLIIIKEEGVYSLRGDQPSNFQVVPLDLTVFCKSADSVAVLANQVFMLSNQGVVAISDTGVQVVSREIEPDVLPLLTFTNISTLATGAAYESERSYYLSVPTISSDAVQNQTYVYNIFTKTWVHWTFGFGAAIVEPGADKLYFGKPSNSTVYRERKSFTDADFADPETAITITALNTTTNTVTFTLSGASANPGYVLQQGSVNLPIKTVTGNLGIYTAVMQGTLPSAWTTGAGFIFPSVGMDVIWDTWTGGGQAGLLKQASEIAILSDNIPDKNSVTALTITAKSNFDVAQDSVALYLGSNGWGDAWGSIPWGGIGDLFGYRTWVPRNKQICRTLNPGVQHQNALERLSCAGYAIQYEVLSERISK